MLRPFSYAGIFWEEKRRKFFVIPLPLYKLEDFRQANTNFFLITPPM